MCYRVCKTNIIIAAFSAKVNGHGSRESELTEVRQGIH